MVTGFDPDVWYGRKPIVHSRFGARTLGSLAELEVGCEAYTIPEARRNSHDEGVGGLILEIIDTPDNTTGELHRSFRCYDPYAPFAKAFRIILEKHVDKAGIEAGDPGRMVNAVRRLCLQVSKGSGLLVPRDAQLVVDAATLAKALMVGS